MDKSYEACIRASLILNDLYISSIFPFKWLFCYGIYWIIDNTLLELKNNNLNSYEAIYFKKYENRNDNFKINARKNIISKGYNIILCIGSYDTDVYGDFTGIPVKIPVYIKNNLEVIEEE